MLYLREIGMDNRTEKKGINIKRKGPIYLTLKLTNNCNLQCIMCGQRKDIHRNNGQEIDFSVLKDMFSETNEIKYLYLFGGEPLLYKNFDNLLEVLRGKRVAVSITTNGVLLKQKAHSIVDSGVKRLEISMDSCKREKLKSIRGIDTFDYIVDGIREIETEKKTLGVDFPQIGLNFVLLPTNYREIREYIDFVEREIPEVEEIYFQFPMITHEEQGKEQSNLIEDEFNTKCLSYKWFNNQDIKFNVGQIRELIALLKGVSGNSKVKYKKYGEDELKKIVEGTFKTQHTCECPYTSLTILPNGDATFCTDFPDVILGNIYNKSVEEIWTSTTAECFRNHLRNMGNYPLCSSCYHIDELMPENHMF